MPHCNILQVKKGFTSFLLIWRSAIIYILIKLYQNPKYSLYYWRSSIVISIYKCSYLDIATYDRARLYLCVKHCVILCGNFETCISILRETMSKLCDLMSYFRDMYIDVARNFVKIVWSYVVLSRHVYRCCEKLCQNCVILCRTFETCISILRETLSKLCDLMS